MPEDFYKQLIELLLILPEAQDLLAVVLSLLAGRYLTKNIFKQLLGTFSSEELKTEANGLSYKIKQKVKWLGYKANSWYVHQIQIPLFQPLTKIQKEYNRRQLKRKVLTNLKKIIYGNDG